jgi:glycosyltransferase A (GT-A) superfamily protein (DUF2064 family)
VDELAEPSVHAVIGPAVDGGYWAIGLRRPVPGVFEGIPMSTVDTARAQTKRLRDLGLRTVKLPVLRDVDDFDDALAVATQIPDSLFAKRVRAVEVEQRRSVSTGG